MAVVTIGAVRMHSRPNWPGCLHVPTLPARRFVPDLPNCSLEVRMRCGSGGCGVIIEALGTFADQSTADKPFESAQGGVVFRRCETERLPDGQCPPGAANAVHVVLGMFRKVVV